MPKKFENLSVTAYYRYHSINDLGAERGLHGVARVAVFCCATVVIPVILLMAPLYIRYSVFQDALYTLGESDLLTVDQRMSTFWCAGQDLRMNATFHAYLLDQQPQISEETQLFDMDKHMELADDSLEYWGFFLLQGSKVTLSVCSRFEGARMMVVKGTKNLKHCALLDPTEDSNEIDPWEEDVSAHVIKVTYQQGDLDIPHEADNNILKQYGDWAQNFNGSLKRPPRRYKSRKRQQKYNGGGKGKNTTRKNQDIFSTMGDGENNNKDESSSKIETNKAKIFPRTKREIEVEHNEEESGSYWDLDDESPPHPVGGPDGESMEGFLDGDEDEEEQTDEMINEEDIRSSGSSFAKNLWTCYGGDTLFTQSFSSSRKCQSQDAMMKYALRMRTVHEIASTGYYYYIFYSDNDIVSNDIFARFNIEKVVYSFPNYTSSCQNATDCSFPLNFLSSEKVLIEIPLQDGVSDEDALAQMVLHSVCKPRWPVYFIFPVAILMCILCCALN